MKPYTYALFCCIVFFKNIASTLGYNSFCRTMTTVQKHQWKYGGGGETQMWKSKHKHCIKNYRSFQVGEALHKLSILIKG